MLNILVVGCSGSVGKVVCDKINSTENMKVVAGVSKTVFETLDFTVYDNIKNVTNPVDIIVDFSSPSSLTSILNFAFRKKVPVIIGTTGYSEQEIELINSASKVIPVFFSSNMSFTINLMLHISKVTTKFLEDTFDIEIIEKHHNKKVDAPSGTALTLAEGINQVSRKGYTQNCTRNEVSTNRKNNEIGIHSVRGGTLTGEHSVLFLGNDETLTITHTAYSKSIFSSGVITAIKFMEQKEKGFYNMDSILNINFDH